MDQVTCTCTALFNYVMYKVEKTYPSSHVNAHDASTKNVMQTSTCGLAFQFSDRRWQNILAMHIGRTCKPSTKELFIFLMLVLISYFAFSMFTWTCACGTCVNQA